MFSRALLYEDTARTLLLHRTAAAYSYSLCLYFITLTVYRVVSRAP